MGGLIVYAVSGVLLALMIYQQQDLDDDPKWKRICGAILGGAFYPLFLIYIAFFDKDPSHD